jgi:branched-chain amino acid transport system ATP-binding protein/urea transport system ATP-binding protein
MTRPALLKLEGVRAGYPGGGEVLDGVALEIGAGECVGLVGRNGMGKTTLLRAVMGQVRVAAGRVSFDSKEITGLPAFAISNAGIAYVPQGREIFAAFTVEENLLLGLLGKRGVARRVPDSIYARFPILAERRTQPAGTMSGGEQQQLAVARAIISRPRLLLLDEPTEGIQPSIVHSLGVGLEAIAREEGLALLLVEQNLELVFALTTRVAFIENGRIAAQSPTVALCDDSALLERYLSV